MSNIVTIGYITEGKTDIRFLQNIIHRTFQEVSFDCTGEIEVFEPQVIQINEGSFVEEVQKASSEASKQGLLVLCVHVDADNSSDENVIKFKIGPAIEAIENQNDTYCKNVIAVVPVQMTESWMLADKTLLKEEIGTEKTDNELQISRSPESISDPKKTIVNAIQIAFSDMTQRQRNRQLSISELYQPLGQKINLSKLEQIPSFLKFKKSVKEAFVKLNYLST